MMTIPPPDPTSEQLQSLATLPEHRFRSDAPLVGPIIAWFRERWNSISTRWYVLPLAQRQSQFNLLVAARLSEHSQTLKGLETGLLEQAVQQQEQSAHLAAHERWLAAHESALAELATRSEEHDTWLSDQDRDAVALGHNQAEITARLIQMERLIDDLERRLAQCEAGAEPRA